MKRPTSCLILSIVLGAGVSESWADEEGTSNRRVHRYALLIGADDYAPPLAKLQYCHHDMSELAVHLENAGFSADDIVIMHDQAENARHRPTRANIERELDLCLQLANPDDIVVVAFSGHGIHLDGVSYLCPSDAHLNGTTSLVSINDVYARMEKCSASEKVLIIDACRDEPIVPGFKSSQPLDKLSLEILSPPRGLVVLSSCEPKQFSAEDPELRHGVFMHYIMEGLQGAADSDMEVSGNNNGKISLDELYYYAHEKTKRHVARTHGIVQRPVMKGEIIGRFDIANVAEMAQLRTIVRREKKEPTQVQLVKASQPTAEPVAESPLLKQANDYRQSGQFEPAITAYTALIDNPATPAPLRQEARQGRAAAYVARGQKEDIDRALVDQLAAGLPGLQLAVQVESTNLYVESVVKGKVLRNQTVLVTKAHEDWLWVGAVDGSDKTQGFIQRSAILAPANEPEAPQVVTTRSPSPPTNWKPVEPDCPRPHPYPGHPNPSNPHQGSPVLRAGKEILRQHIQSKTGFHIPRW